MTIGIDAQKLVAAVIDSGLGEVEICSRAGVAHQTFSKMLKGKMVRFPSVGKVCQVLNVKPSEVIRDVSDEAIPAQRQLLWVHPDRERSRKAKHNAPGILAATVGRVSS